MQPVKLFLCGDVMTGRGIDQILRHSCDPRIYEGYVKDARDYVRLAERASGAVPRGVGDAYIWGDALEELARAKPDARIINLETAVTRSDDWMDKRINYRMHPANVGCLTAAGTDCCTLANNHVLDWGEGGLVETLETLRAAGLRTVGAGRNREEAQAPARRPGDLVLVSLHWGGNWGYRVPPEQAEFAHKLIDLAAADLVHGHSSHHPKAAEIYRGKLILYGCGDFINDYEGISGHEEFRGDLGVMYFPTLASGSGELLDLELVALCRRRLRLERAPEIDCQWLCGVLNAEGRRFGSSFDLRPRSRFALRISGSWVSA
jgi:poly-gamma-glutamate synthesis protein (capsule biosynthesis protein)